MILFKFGKGKDNNKTIKSANKETESKFYTECVEAFHFKAMDLGVAKNGLIYIPELIPYGEKTVLEFLKDPFFQQEFSSDPVMYYAFIMGLCIDAGIVYAAKWHEDYSGLSSYVKRTIEDGPAKDAEAVMKANLPQDLFSNQGNPFFSQIFPVWLTLHEPYWKLKDPRNYTFQLMLAAYQLGISVILCELGY